MENKDNLLNEAEATVESQNENGVKQVPIRPKKNSGITSRIRSLMNLKEFDIETSVPTANTSFLKSKYGHADSSEERLDSFMKEFCTDIETKNTKGEYACVKVLPEDLAVFKDAIINIFKDKGYTVADLKQCIENVGRDYIFLCWDKFDSKSAE